MKAPQVVVTSSWDDGHVLDHRLASLLDCHGVRGTFYIAPRSVELVAQQRLSSAGIRELSTRFEIGGHTLTHQRLPSLGLATADADIREGKEDLEQVLGSPVTSFCYPGGAYRPEHIGLVQRAGFTMARTVRRFSTAFPTDPYQVHTTVHAYRHLRDPLAAIRYSGVRPRRALQLFANWECMAIAQFEIVLRAGGVFHLWGHSWEIDARGDWRALDRLLGHIGRRANVRYVTNGELAGQVRR